MKCKNFSLCGKYRTLNVQYMFKGFPAQKILGALLSHLFRIRRENCEIDCGSLELAGLERTREEKRLQSKERSFTKHSRYSISAQCGRYPQFWAFSKRAKIQMLTFLESGGFYLQKKSARKFNCLLELNLLILHMENLILQQLTSRTSDFFLTSNLLF